MGKNNKSTLKNAKSKSRISKKLTKKSEIAAKKLDKDVSKLKVKELKNIEVNSNANQDLVADKSWQLPSHSVPHLTAAEEVNEQKLVVLSNTPDADSKNTDTSSTANNANNNNQEPTDHPQTATASSPKFQDYGSSETTRLGQDLNVVSTTTPAPILSQIPEVVNVQHEFEPPALTISMVRTTLTQVVHPLIIGAENHQIPLTIDGLAQHQSVKEDTLVASASGKLQAHGYGATQLQWSVTDIQGQFGRLDIEPDTGEWHYRLDNSANNTDALAEGERQTEQFIITATNPNGEQVSTTVTVEVEGSNDLPHILGTHLASIGAAETLDTVVGQLNTVDPDHGDITTWAVIAGQGQYGQLIIDPQTGQWQYQLNNQSIATQALISGQQVTEMFTVTATDQSGHPVLQQVTIQVNGADNIAVIKGDLTGSVTEDNLPIDGLLTVSGQLSIQDPDANQAQFTAGSLQGQFGHLAIDSKGHWTYSADNSQAVIQSLKSGEHLTDTLMVYSIDGTEQKITVTINGTDDKPLIGGIASVSLAEDTNLYQGLLRADGTLTVINADHGQNLFQATEQHGQFGSLTIDELGHWVYTADNSQFAIQGLKTGESVIDTLFVYTLDGTPQKISITINGTDDQSLIMGTSVMRVFEDKHLYQGQLRADGQLIVTNPDMGRARFTASLIQGQFGILSINDNGHWTYTIDNNSSIIQGLKAGESLIETLIVQALDGTSQKVSILIKGADDQAMIGGTATASLNEDKDAHQGQLNVEGTLTVTDADAGQSQFVASLLHGQFGTLTINELGHWTYIADNSQAVIQSLKSGEYLTDTLMVHSIDGTEQKVTITINGTDDKAIIAGASTASLTEDVNVVADKLQAAGQLTLIDPDAGQDHFAAQTDLVSNLGLGHFSIDATGHWIYAADNTQTAIQQLKADESLTDTMTVTSVDGTTHTITVTLKGTNDSPVLTAQTQAVTEDGSQLNGKMSATDVDAGDTLTFSLAIAVDGFTLNADGSYSFDPSNVAYQHLAAGQIEDVVIPVTVTDHYGATSTQSLTITVTGANDSATIAGVSTGSATEDRRQAVTGQLTIADVDDGEAHFTAQQNTASAYGSLTLSEDGQWSYALNNSNTSVQALKAGESLTDTLTVESVDGTQHTITVTINGRDDGAVIGGVDTAAVSEDTHVNAGHLDTSGQLTITDADAGQAQFIAQTSAAGYGEFAIDTSGHWSYSADNTQSAVQQLKTGESLTDSLTVTSADGTTHTVTVTIQGTNDAPVLQAQTQAVTEGGAMLSGYMAATDVDAGDTQTFSLANAVDGFTLNADGSYSFDPSHVSYQHLAVGQTQDLIIPVAVTDSAGATNTQNLTITITGSNDGAVIGGVNIGAVTEDSTLTASGTLTISDSDSAQAGFIAQTNLASIHGSFTLTASGDWTYVLDNSNAAVQALKTGESLTDTVNVNSIDGTQHTITVTINGRDDGAVIGGVDTATVTEDMNVAAGKIEANGQLTITDPDAGQAQFMAQTTTSGTYGEFVMDANGAWNYQADNSRSEIQQLKASATLTETFTAISTDGTTHQIHITITGSNDVPVIAAQTQSVIEDGTQLSGKMIATDVDAGDTQTFSIASSVDGFILNADGSYSFDPSHASYQHLAAGQTQDVVIPITVTDGAGGASTKNLTITVTGTNDIAVITKVDAGFVTEDRAVQGGTIQAFGTLGVTDADAGQAQFIAQSSREGANGLGHFTFTSDGHWTFSADNSQTAIQQLKAGDSLTDSLTVSSIDGTTYTITVTIQGSNDIPALAAQTQAVSEDGTLLSGHMVASDVDAGDTQTFSLANAVDGFTLNADGSYSFDPGHASYQHLAAGQTQDLIIPITVTDGAGATATQNLTIRLTGTNDAARINGTDIGRVVEDQTLSVSGKLDISDADDGQANFIVQTATAGSYGSLTLGEDGRWQYQLDNSKPEVQALKSTETATDTFTVHSADGSSHCITVTIQGQRDNVVIGGVDVGVVKEDVSAVTGGHLVATGESAEFVPLLQRTALGNFAMDASGAWTYTLDNSRPGTDALKSGETATETVTITHTDGTTHTVTITVMGTNDAPVLSAQTQAVTEDGTQLSGHMIATDVDAGDTLTFSLANAVDGFTLNADGSYSFDPSHASYQHLAAGQTQDVVIPVTVTDSAGASSTQNLSITVTGTNDGPTIAGVNTGSTAEDNTQAVTGQLSIADADDSQAHFVAQNAAGSYGSITLAEDGQWSYQLDNSKADVQALKTGETVTDSFTVTTADGTTHIVSVTVAGWDDGAVIAGTDTGTVAEDTAITAGHLQVNGQLTITDPDAGQAHFTAQTYVVGSSGYGHFSLDTTGGWTYTADNTQTAVQQLKAGDSLTDTLTVTSGDGTMHTVTVTLQGTNDAPVLAAQTQAVTEDGTQLSGHMLATDVDAGDTQTFSIANVFDGFTLNADGSYSFDPSHASYQHLAAGQTQDVIIPITVTDSAGATATQNLTIRLTGTNDAARISGTDVGRVVEDQTLSVSGQLAISDADDGQARFVAQTATAGSYGSLTIGADGQWQYQLDNSKPEVQALKSTETATDSFTVHSADGSSHNITVTIQGQRDSVVIGGVDVGVVKEDVSLVTGGHLVDTGESAEFVPLQQHTTLGEFSMDAAGAWTFTLDNSRAGAQALKDGETATDSVTITHTDGTTHTVTLTVMGTNDAPVLSAQTQAIIEDGTQLTGHMAASDVDAGDTQTFSLANAVDGFTLNADGSYSFDPGNAAYQHLAAGQAQDVIIPITVTDSAGATSTQNLMITVTGSNDGPLVTHGTAATAADLGAINEDAPRVFTETELLQAVGASAVDDGTSVHIVAGSLASAHGTFTGDAAHGYTFTPAANYSGQDVDLQFSVSDGAVSREAHGQLDITPVADTLRVSELPESGKAKTLVSSVDFQAHSSFERMPATIQGWNNEGGDLLLQRPNGGANTVLVMRGTDDATVGTHFATKPGQIYELTLSAYSSGNIKLEVVWNGQVVSSYTPEGGWGEQSFRFLADSDQSYLQLRAHDGAGQFAHVTVDYTQLRMREPLPVLATQPVSLGGLDTFTQFHLRDMDGSETLSYVIKGLPVGFTLSDGSHSVTVTKADQVIDTQGWAPDQLHLMAPTGFEGVVGFQVAARSEEGANHQQGALTAFVPQALSFDSPVVIEDTPRHFSEAQLLSFAGLHAAAGVSYGVSDVQVDAAFGHITHNSDGSWTFTPAANVSADQVPITLTVTGGAQPLTASLALSITPVVDTPLGAGGQTELTDFNHQAVGSAGWAMVDPSGMGWHTDHAQGVELGQDKLYGGSSTSNQIVSLSASSDSNLYRDLSISAGEVVHFGFDLSARAGVAIAPLQVLWEGKVIDTITPASGYAMAHHEYDLVATGANSRLELRATGSSDARALIDNLQLSTTPPQVALVNHALHLDLGQSFQLADTDGSETLSYLIKDLPVGFTLSDGSHSVTATTAGQQIDLKGWQLDALVLQSPADFEGQLALKVSASAEEGATHQTATSAELLLPLSFEHLSTAEDTPRSFSERELLQLAGAVPAPGQHLSLSDVQVDPAFGQITHNADGSWTFTPAANVSADQVALNLTVAGGAQPQVALPLQITAVTDAPVAGMLSIHPDISSQNPGSAGWAYLDPTQVGWHTDHHEGVYIGTATRYGGADSHSLLELSGLASSPMNFYRTLNTQAGQTLVFSFDLTGRPGRPAATIEVLFEGKVIDTLTPGNQAYDMQRHEYVLTATGPDSRLELRPSGQGDARALFDNLQISPPPQVGLVNHALHLDVGQAFQLADTDGSETISYLINGLPVGFTLSDGSHSVTVTTAGQVIDTAGWQMDAVTVEAPKDFEGQLDLKISARTEESATHQTVTSAELPLPLSFERLSTAEDTPRSFSEHELLQLAGAVPAPGEHLSLSDVQVDPAFGHVTHNADGSWTFTPVANVSADQVALSLTVSGGAQAQQLALPIQITAVTDAPLLGAGVSTSDFEQQRVTDSSGSKFIDAGQFGWRTEGSGGVEVGKETTFGGTHADNQVVELISKGGSTNDPDLYRDLTTFAGQQLHFAFDLSRRAGWAVGPVEVLWEGKVIDTITPTDSGFAFHHHAYDLVATGGNSRLELRVLGDNKDQRAVVDNLYVGPPPQMALVNHDLHLKVDEFVRLADTDGSETLSLLIKGLPVGFTLTDGSHSVTVTAADQVIDTQGWQQDALSIQSTKDFAGTLNLSISGRSEEGSTHQTATTAELPVRLSFESLATTEDTALTLDEDKLLALAGVVPAAGEHLSLSDVQVDPAFGQVTHNADGSWTFTPEANVSADQVLLTLMVSGGSQPITATLPLNITPVVDKPVVDIPAGIVDASDFEGVRVTDSSGSQFVDPAQFGWHSDGAHGVELGKETLFGGTQAGNQVVELISQGASGYKDANLYRDLATQPGQQLHFSFDLSRRDKWAIGPVEVLWEGKVIDTITPSGDGYAMHHHAYDLLATGSNSRIELRVVGDTADQRAVIDNLEISGPPQFGLANHDLLLDLTHHLHLADTDGSETLTYIVKGLPVGFTLTDGTHSVTVATAGQLVETAGWAQDAIMVRPPQDFHGQLNLQVSARAEETANHQTATSADMEVRLSFENLSTAEDTPKTFTESELLQLAGIRAPAGQTYVLSDVQVDPAFGHVSHDANGGWTFTPAANVSADQVPLTLTVTGGAQPITATLPMSITPVVDAPVHEASTGGSGQAISTDFNSVAVGGDGWAFVDGAGTGWHTDYAKGIQVGQDKLYGGSSSSNQIVELTANAGKNIYRELPTTAGQTLHFGFDLSARGGNSVATLEVVWEGKVIDTITPASGFALVHHAYDLLATGANSRLELRATGGGDGRAIIDNIDIGAPVDPLLAQVNHDLHLNLTHDLHLADTDGSETLTYIVKGLPVGFTLTDGTHSATVATAGEVIETTGWNQDALMVRAPQDYAGQLAIQVSARAEETGNHQTATSADMTLSLSFENPSTAEDTPKTFTGTQIMQLAGIVAPAGQTYTLGDVQVDPAFGHFAHDADGKWTFTPAANVSADAVPLTLHVDGGAQPITGSLTLSVTPVADAPVHASAFNALDFDSDPNAPDKWVKLDDFGWSSNNREGIERVPEDVYHGDPKNRIATFSSQYGDHHSLYHDLATRAGEAFHFSFDTAWTTEYLHSKVPIEVLWEGKVIDTLLPTAGDDLTWAHHQYDLVATGTSSRLELRVAGNGQRGMAAIDNLAVGPATQFAATNHDLALDTGFRFVDTDGSETFGFVIKGLPLGFTLTDGTHSVTVATADQAIDTKGWDQDALAVRAPQGFEGELNLRVVAQSEETANHQTATSDVLPLHLSFIKLGVAEDTPKTFTDAQLLGLSGIRAPAGQTYTLGDVQVDPAFGHFSHDANGSWTFTPAANVNADQVPFTLTVTGGAQPISTTLQLAITPVNDGPVLAAQTQAVTEDAAVFNSHVLATDPDAGDTLAFSTTATADGFTLNADGSYSFDPTHASYQHLAAGQTQDVVIAITVTDSAGATSTQNLTITVTGSDDGPQVTHGTAATAADLGVINEDAPRVFTEAELLQAVGASDADDGSSLHIVAGSLTSTHGSFTGDATHGFTFTPAANFSGQDVDLKFSVSDGTVSRDAFATLDITPVADAPVRGGLSITTDFNSVDVGAGGWKLSDPTPLGWQSSEASGVEIGQERLYGGSGNNQILSLTASWSSNIFRDLATQAGQKVHVGFDLSARPGFAMTPVEVVWEGKVVDTISPTAGTFAMQHHAYDLVATGSSSRLEFRATGQGEARALFDNIQIGPPDHLTLGDQDILLKPYLGYQLADTDGSETLSYAIHGLPVGFTLTDGTHSVTVATAGQVIETTGWNQEALALRAPHDFQGDTSIQVSARAEEGSNHQSASAADFTLHLSGVPVSHVAVIGGDTAVTVTEDQQVNSNGNLEHFGQLSIVDPDAGQAQFVPQNAVVAKYGHYTIDQNGFWLYEADNKLAAIQQLKTGEHLTDSFTVHSADGTAQTITVTIQGQDDAPAFVPHGGPTQSDDAYSQIGHAFEWMSHPNFKYLASMMLQGADTYPFERALVVIKNAGVSFISPDGSVAKAFGPHGGTLTEVPISEMIAWHAKGAGYQVVFTDAKASEVGVYAYNNGNPGMLSGRYPYTDFVLHPEQSATHLTPVMHDVAAASGGFAVQGTAVMPPAIAPLQYDSANVLEDNGQQISGFIDVKDAEAGQSAMKSQTDVATQHDHFDLAPDGHWTYSEDNTQSAVQQLKAGENLTDTLAVTSADGTPHTVTVTIQSTNETPEITAQIQAVTEDGIENREAHALLDNTPVDDAASSDEAAQGLGLASQPSEALYADQTAAIHHVGINNESHNLVLSDEGVAAVRALAIEPAAIANVDMISVVHSASADEHVVASALASPIDPYLQMVGITPNTFETPTSTQTRMDLTLTEIPAISTQDSETDMLDISHVNHFENPLLDDAKDQHKDQGIDIFEGSYTHLDGNSNDDDLLHSALNDMHNQM
ncbi:VCBS repeat-containing protein [Shewanella putrefaciens]|nr:VCBS repeat-containing protein [Shewanella putrefaciens]